ncbi:hypothetical protein QU811_27760, partial [Escherichia coli]|nr:hypothetical protein [Escherichia coli]
QLMKAVYEMARKGAQDELRLQLRDGEGGKRDYRHRVRCHERVA